MTQNNGDNAELAQTEESARQTTLTINLLKKQPELGAVVDNYGRILGVLAWFTESNKRWAKIDNGTITAPADGRGEVTVKIQDRTTGLVRTYTMRDPVSAFYALGLSAGRCNGIDGWLALSLMPGSAGCD